MAIIYNSTLFYFYFGETLSKAKILGMALTIFCVILLAIDTSEPKNEMIETESKYAVYGLLLALVVPIGFSFKHFLIRKFKGSYDYIYLPLDSGILETFSCSLMIFWFMEDGQFDKFEPKKLLLGGLSGTFLLGGKVFIAYAIAGGQAGPA